MSRQRREQEVAAHWMGRADAALASAASEIVAASAVLLKRGRKFVKHSGVRGSVHRDLVKAGLLEASWGKVYDRAFGARQIADYLAFGEVERAEAEALLASARGFVREMERLFAAASP
jgi:uncharacterized protein (UPF0332 family)